MSFGCRTLRGKRSLNSGRHWWPLSLRLKQSRITNLARPRIYKPPGRESRDSTPARLQCGKASTPMRTESQPVQEKGWNSLLVLGAVWRWTQGNTPGHYRRLTRRGQQSGWLPGQWFQNHLELRKFEPWNFSQSRWLAEICSKTKSGYLLNSRAWRCLFLEGWQCQGWSLVQRLSSSPEKDLLPTDKWLPNEDCSSCQFKPYKYSPRRVFNGFFGASIDICLLVPKLQCYWKLSESASWLIQRTR